VALYNHDEDHVLGRKSAGTLELEQRSDGLWARIPQLPRTGIGPYIREGVTRGDLKGMNFAFILAPGGDSWSKEPDGTVLRTVNKIAELADISIVTSPAYSDTTVSVRSLEQAQRLLSSRPRRGWPMPGGLFTRPWGWWYYDAEEPRRRIGGPGEPCDPDEWSYIGTPNAWATYDTTDPPRFESERDYLTRLDLLFDVERAS